MSNNNKKQLQDQVYRLTNEIEELRLEREESKKNVLHFMQEADTIRQKLKRAQEIIEELTLNEKGYNSPPPESDNDEDDHLPSSLKKKRTSLLFSKLSLLDEEQLSTLFQLLEEGSTIKSLKSELSQANQDNAQLKEELDQLKEEYEATRSALQVENERAEIIESRWKESESHLEQAEYTIQSLKKELEKSRQEWSTTNNNNLDNKLSGEIVLCEIKKELALAVNNFDQCKSKLEQTQSELKQYQQSNEELKSQIVNYLIYYSFRYSFFVVVKAKE